MLVTGSVTLCGLNRVVDIFLGYHIKIDFEIMLPAFSCSLEQIQQDLLLSVLGLSQVRQNAFLSFLKGRTLTTYASAQFLFEVQGVQLRILLKQNTALLSTVRVCVTGVTSHISHIYKGINAMLIISDPSTPIYSESKSSWLSFQQRPDQTRPSSLT